MPGLSPHLRRALLLAAVATLGVALAIGLPRAGLRGGTEPDDPAMREPVVLSADFSQEWTEGDDEIAILRGRCRIVQGETTLSAHKAVVWRRREKAGRSTRDRLAIYLEGDARVERPGHSAAESSLLVYLTTQAEVTHDVRRPGRGEPAADDALFQRAQARRKGSQRTGLLQQTQLLVPADEPLVPDMPGVHIAPPAGNLRRVRIFPRSAVPFNVETHVSERTTPPEQVWVITGGVNVVIDGVDLPERLLLESATGRIGLSADRAVIWTPANLGDDLGQFDTVQSREVPFTVYLEGNVVIRQGPHILRATHAVYDAHEDRALMLNAELRAFIPEFQGDIRLAAERMRQLSQRSFHAQNGWISTSQFGKPGYRVQASDVFYEYRTPLFGAGATIDPITGLPVVEETPWITGVNNVLFVEDVPVFYLPWVSMPARRSPIPLRQASAGYDQIFGAQVRTTWDMGQILGLEIAPGNQWDLLADFMSERGPAVGSRGLYSGTDLFGLPGAYNGNGLGYYVFDRGTDVLGSGRMDLIPPSEHRYRMLLRHRHRLPQDVLVFGELGLISDRNFLEQYFLQEFDTGKDNEALLYARQNVDNFAWTLQGRVQINEFDPTTEWLPRGDLYLLSEPLLDGWLTWSTHTSAAYARLRQAAPPTDPRDLFVPIPYITNAEGLVAMTRHELNAPLNLGPVHVVPFVMGEAAFWSEDFTGNAIDRYVLSSGLRSSLTIWRTFPQVQSWIFDLNGLAHKIRFEADYAWTEASRSLDGIPQYNEFDDDAQERFRMRFPVNTFGGFVPPQFDPRFYGVRTGAGLPVTAPWHELVDDQQVLRAAIRQRLQTRTGPPERQRIRDWMTLDLEASYFPRPNRDNFDEEFGLLGGRYAWHFSEATSLLASAQYDVFENAPRLWDVAFVTQRGERGSLNVGMRQISGPGLDSRILTASYIYQMSPKWRTTMGTAYDLGEGENLGQSLTVTRIGADFLIHVGANIDPVRRNAGFALMVEPRFVSFGALASPQPFGQLLGTQR